LFACEINIAVEGQSRRLSLGNFPRIDRVCEGPNVDVVERDMEAFADELADGVSIISLWNLTKSINLRLRSFCHVPLAEDTGSQVGKLASDERRSVAFAAIRLWEGAMDATPLIQLCILDNLR